jgi:importin subunit beta-1
MMMLSAEMVNESSQPHIRNAAGLALKNALTARVCITVRYLPTRLILSSIFQEAARQQDYANRWLGVDTQTKGKIKQDALLTLASAQQRAGTVAAQVVAAIAAVELPQGQWPELIDVLLGFVNDASNTNLRIATLEAIGFVCESVVSLDPDPCECRDSNVLAPRNPKFSHNSRIPS